MNKRLETNEIKRDEAGTAYISDADGQTRVYAIELDNNEGWVLERQAVGGDENPERLSCHDSEDEAMDELATYLAAEIASAAASATRQHNDNMTQSIEDCDDYTCPSCGGTYTGATANSFARIAQGNSWGKSNRKRQ